MGFEAPRILAALGYFDDASDTPAFDPGPAALCPVCDQPMGALTPETTKCRSLWVTNDRSHFFYYHAGCAGDGKAKIAAFEDAVVDLIVAQEQKQ